jgi:hypothetical protein
MYDASFVKMVEPLRIELSFRRLQRHVSTSFTKAPKMVHLARLERAVFSLATRLINHYDTDA